MKFLEELASFHECVVDSIATKTVLQLRHWIILKVNQNNFVISQVGARHQGKKLSLQRRGRAVRKWVIYLFIGKVNVINT